MDDLKYVAHYAGHYRRDFVFVALCVFVESVLELMIPFMMARIVDVGIATGNLGIALGTGLEMVAAAVLAGVAGLGYSRLSAKFAMGFGANLRHAEYAHVQEYAFENLDGFEASSLVTRMTTDVTVVQNALVTGLRPLMRGPVMLVMGLVLACTLSLDLAVVFFAILPVLAIALGIIVSHVAPLYAVLQRSMDRLNETLQEDLVAIRAIKAYVREGYVAERFDEVNRRLAESAQRTFGIAVANVPVFQGSMGVANTALLLIGGTMVMEGTLGVGALTGFMSYVLLIMNSLMMISNVFLLVARGITSVHRIREVLEEEPALTSPEGGLTQVPSGDVRFEDVSFKYHPDAERDVLEHVSLHFPSGSSIGIIGGTGSGKSSLVQLLPRLYDATSGTVLVGGHDVRDYDLATIRDAVGIVLQKNVLFSGTVRDNLRWGDSDATDEEMLEACRMACADEFLGRIGGLDGDLGHGGGNVSGGQKQRLCIARTLLKHPRVMIFDDSTSAVDTKTDARIRASLAELAGVTTIVIAQRVSSVMEADQIVILDDGRVHATGTHEELLAYDPLYQELCESQGVASLSSAVNAVRGRGGSGTKCPSPNPGGTECRAENPAGEVCHGE